MSVVHTCNPTYIKVVPRSYSIHKTIHRLNAWRKNSGKKQCQEKSERTRNLPSAFEAQNQLASTQIHTFGMSDGAFYPFRNIHVTGTGYTGRVASLGFAWPFALPPADHREWSTDVWVWQWSPWRYSINTQ